MSLIRRLILTLALFAGITPAFAQAPAPVPVLPDTERRTTYSISAGTCACNVNFALYGDSTDYQDWIEVFLNGVQQLGNWTITSPTGPLAIIPRPITDAVLTFTSAQTGTVQIVGARRPRRASQFGQTVTSRDLNRDLTDIIAQNRETWDKTNDVSGRTILAPPGETLAMLPTQANRASQGACFNSAGNLAPCVSIPSSTFTAGTAITFSGVGPTAVNANPTATAPIVIDPTTKNISCPTCGAASGGGGGVAPGGRLTLTSVTPVMTTSVAGATTVYYTPYAGNMVPIYDGTNMVPTAFAEVSQATADTTKSPAAVAVSKIYDVFCWVDSGTNRCTRGPAWTNATTRGYTLTMTNGILLNTSSITNGPAALRGTWVGTVASNASSTIDYIFGSTGSGGVAAVLNVWNAYNRVTVGTSVIDNGTAYTYTTATARQARASAGNQVSFVVGSQEDSAFSTYSSKATTTAAGAFPQTGIGLDTTSAFSNVPAILFSYAGVTLGQLSSHMFNPAIGTHTVAAIEQGDGTNANSFDTSSIATLSFQLRM